MGVLPGGVLARDIGPRTNPGEVSAIYGAHLDEASTKRSKRSLTAARFLFYKRSRLAAVGSFQLDPRRVRARLKFD